MAVTVRPLSADDYAQWRPLWDGYTHFYDCFLDESVTASTWERALSAHSPMFCRVVEKDEKIIGFAMCILHEGTWSTAPVCYLEDLFVDATRCKPESPVFVSHCICVPDTYTGMQ